MSRPVGKAPVGRPPTKGTSSTTSSAPMARTVPSSTTTASGRYKGTAATPSVPTTTVSNATSNTTSNLHTYRELLIARSDGIGYTTQQINDASRSAQPVGDALDDATELVRSWSVKLGKALKYNLGVGSSATTTADPNNYLVRFPAGYTLHVRPGNKSKSTGRDNHRDGPLVFGHPLSPIAVFRSPAEFALHLLWLLSASKARADCSCRLCVRMVSEGAGRAETAVEARQQVQQQAPLQSQAQPQSQLPQQLQPQQQQHQQQQIQQQLQQQQPRPAPRVSTPAQPTATAPAPAVQPPQLQPLPAGGSSALFRPWELVWYQHFLQPSRGAWRLGIVLRIERMDAAAPPAAMPGPAGTICLAPIGFKGLEQLLISASELRPFLSFSVPAMRPGFQGLTYDQIDWHKLVVDAQQRQQQQQQQRGGQPPLPLPGQCDVPTIALEASKAAANQINACFSVFNQLPKETPRTTKCTFGGVFLGAEMILVGDAVRVDAKEPASDSSGVAATTRLVIAGEEQEDKESGHPAHPHPRSVDVMQVTAIMTEQGQLRLFGNIYRLALALAGSVLPPMAPMAPMAPQGPVFDEELAERNRTAANTSTGTSTGSPGSPLAHPTWFWRLRELNASRAESEVHGRFYASTRLAANLQNTGFVQRVQHEPLAAPYDDGCMAASALNRRQKVADFMYLGERQNRAATIGQAMSIPLPAIHGVKEGI